MNITIPTVVVNPAVILIPGLEVSPQESLYHLINLVSVEMTNTGNPDSDIMAISKLDQDMGLGPFRLHSSGAGMSLTTSLTFWIVLLLIAVLSWCFYGVYCAHVFQQERIFRVSLSLLLLLNKC